MKCRDRDQRPHKVDKIDDAKEFEDEASQVVDDDASEIRKLNWVELNVVLLHFTYDLLQ